MKNETKPSVKQNVTYMTFRRTKSGRLRQNFEPKKRITTISILPIEIKRRTMDQQNLRWQRHQSHLQTMFSSQLDQGRFCGKRNTKIQNWRESIGFVNIL